MRTLVIADVGGRPGHIAAASAGNEIGRLGSSNIAVTIARRFGGPDGS